MSDDRRLVLAAKRTAGTADLLSARFARLLAEVLKDTERKLRPLVQDAAEGNRTAIVKASQANRTRTQIRTVLTEAGFDALAETAYGDSLDRLTDRVLASRRLAQLSADLTPRIGLRLEALKALYQVDLLDEGDEVARQLWKATVRGIFGSREPDVILDDLGAVLDKREPVIRTLYDTSVSIYGRQVEALQAGDDPDTKFAYVGPLDEKTREFCLEHIGKVYTRAEIDDLDNGQLNDVFLTGGGYQCRHMWHEIAKSSELQDLGNQRVPEIQDELDALREAA